MLCAGMFLFDAKKEPKKRRCSARTKNSICYPALRSGKSNFLHVLAATQRTRAGMRSSSPKILDASRGQLSGPKGNFCRVRRSDFLTAMKGSEFFSTEKNQKVILS